MNLLPKNKVDVNNYILNITNYTLSKEIILFCINFLKLIEIYKNKSILNIELLVTSLI